MFLFLNMEASTVHSRHPAKEIKIFPPTLLSIQTKKKTKQNKKEKKKKKNLSFQFVFGDQPITNKNMLAPRRKLAGKFFNQLSTLRNRCDTSKNPR